MWIRLDYVFFFFLFMFLVVHSKVEATSKETRKRSLVDLKANEYYGSCSNSNLIIKNSSRQNSENLQNGPQSSSSLPLYLSSILGSDFGGTAKAELPSMIVMGCTLCLMHTMVSKGDPRCPMCKNHLFVVDKFQMNPAKKIRNGQI